MTLTVGHAYNSTVAEDPASGTPGGLVGPNEWNAAHTWAGATSGGVLYFSGSTTAASSAALSANALVIGGGAGTAPFTASGTSWDNTNLALTITGATVTTSNPILNLSQTWNAGGITFTGLKVNITNTASAAGSLLQDWQVGGNSILQLQTANASLTSANLKFFNTADNSEGGGFSVIGDGNLGVSFGGHYYFSFATTVGFGVGANEVIRWNANNADFAGSYDVVLARDAAAILAQRNSTNAQTLRIYNTFTDASNYERGVLDWTTNSNVLTIGTQKAGTGSIRNLEFVIGGTNQLDYGISNGGLWTAGSPITVASTCVMGFSSGLYFSVGTLGGYQFSASSNALSTGDVGFDRAAANVVEINNGTLGSITGTYIHWGGQARVTSDVTNATASLADATGLSVSVAAGRTYSFEVQISFTDAAAGGIQVAMVAANSLTATNIIYDGWIIDSAANGIKGNTQATALSGVVASATTTGTAGHVTIYGVITVNAAGTLKVQFAQNTSNGTATTVKRGSYMLVHDMP